MKLLLLGCNGQVGWELQRALQPLGEVIACDFDSPPEDLAKKYNDRAGIEPLLAEFKSAWGIDKVPSTIFAANHAALLLKLLAHNLLRRYVAEHVTHLPALRSWRAPWLRRALILIPGRLVRKSRTWHLRMSPRPAVMPLLN